MLIFAFVFSLLSWLVPAFSAPAAPQRIDPCSVYGAVYFEKSRSQSDFSIYIEQETGMGQLTVFKEDNKLFADQAGLWYVVDEPSFANYVVHITKDRGLADFSINYTTTRSFAGCR